MSDLVVNVRQVSSYPQLAAASGSENVLVQTGGLGGPYQAISTAALVSTALQNGGPLGVGLLPPAGARAASIYTGAIVFGVGEGIDWSDTESFTYQSTGFQWTIGGPVSMVLSNAGALSLPFGTLTVARDPGAALEVATMQYVGSHTVATFNGRNGVVQLTSSDVYQALCLDGAIATQTWVCSQLNAAFQAMLQGTVVRWNGRAGNVFLTLSDITCVFFGGGQQPISPTPPVGSDDESIATTAWVVSYVTSEFAGAGSLATQAWVLANTVNSFNTRQGAVTLTLQDITQAGGAPINSPNLTGIPQAPTANPGQATGQIATTAFVQQAVIASTTGVVSWNTRTGAVVLTDTDIYDAGGALMDNAALTGVPTAPTATLGTATTQIATTAFVMNEVAATTAGVSSFNTRTGNVVLTTADITGAGGAPIASPAFTGTPTVPTPVSPIAATTTIPNTNWVVQYVSLNSVSSFNSRTGAIVLTANDLTAAGGLANPSPSLTGTPLSTTAVPGTNTTQIATCAFVQTALANVAGIIVSATPPASPMQGTGWFDMSKAQLFVWTGTTWVIAVNPPTVDTTSFAQLSGATFTGPVTLPAGSTVAGYLPLTGGVLSGNLGVSSALPASETTTLGIVYATNGLSMGPGANLRFNTASGAIALTTGAGALMIQNVSTGQLSLSVWPSANAGVAFGAGSNYGFNPGGTVQLSGPTQTTLSLAPANGNGPMQITFGATSTWGQIYSDPSYFGIGITGTFSGATAFRMLFTRATSIWQYLNGTTQLQAIDAVGNMTIGGTLTQGSDVSSKTNIAPITQGISLVRQLIPKAFAWLTSPTKTQWGFIAQDVQPVIPAAVSETANDTLALDTTAILAALTYTIQQLDKRCAALEAAASITPPASALA